METPHKTLVTVMQAGGGLGRLERVRGGGGISVDTDESRSWIFAGKRSK